LNTKSYKLRRNFQHCTKKNGIPLIKLGFLDEFVAGIRVLAKMNIVKREMGLAGIEG